MKKIYILLFLGVLLLLGNTACNDFLDVAPDSRTQIDSEEKITKLLVSAYPDKLFIFTTETSSDNTDWRDNTRTSVSEVQDQLFLWQDVQTNATNDSPEDYWTAAYGAIASANHAIRAIDEMGNPASLNPQMGEALLCRAYGHFCLVNVFAKHYSAQTGESDLGIAYADKPETTANPYYERLSVAEVYRRIESDLLNGLELVDDNLYPTAPKYHFNRKAAYAFAARFYLYYKKYDKVIEYANEVLGEKPERVLRNMKEFASLPTAAQTRAQYYGKSQHNANLLISSPISSVCNYFGNYGTGKRYLHSKKIAINETTQSPGPWGVYTGDLYYLSPGQYDDGYVFSPKNPYYFEYTDPVARTGYTHTLNVAFHTDETLLCRAEAYILLQQYDNATADLNVWLTGHTTSKVILTPELINEYYKGIEYYRADDPTPKKELHPEDPIVSELQENMLHCLLHIRRIETIHEGLRWFDVKRYNIVIHRRHLDENENVKVLDTLLENDERRAIQLPASVIGAGMTPNPRTK
ncbi:MAG: RagB/SusD family nutrient uptake outer membrane protein [Dysgonamonadaceae bacterium]|nr:RagB/SusD family nutrient uptake outer membrane protein [Dysgonamonadaceae bacterium]